MPSAADIIFLALVAVLLFTSLSVRLLGDAGIGWHIRTGQQILTTHSIPHVDPFSSTMGGNPGPARQWFAWEWLYDLFVGQLEAMLGLNGVVWLTAAVIAVVFAAMFRLLVLSGVNLLVAVILVLLATGASTIHFLARPHVLSWLFALAWFWILDSSEYECVRDDRPAAAQSPNQRQLWLLPLLMLVWVNVHGGFLLGFVLLAIYWLGAVWEWLRTSRDRLEDLLHRAATRRRATHLIYIGLLSAAASLANPYGWKLHEHVYAYLSNRFLMDHIEEFQSPNFHGVAQKCFLLLLLIALATLAARGRHLRLSQVLTVLFAVYAGLDASRNIPVSSVLLVMIIAPLLTLKSLDWPILRRMAAVETGLHGHVWAIVAVVATFCVAANGGRVGSRPLMDAHFDPQRMPVAAVDELQELSVAGPILSPDFWGGYLIYRLYPATRVVVDDRHDFYGDEFFKSYLKFVHGEPGWQDFLAKHDAGCIVVPSNATLATLLPLTDRWRAIYADPVATIFVRDRALR